MDGDQLKKILHYIKLGQQEGAKMVTGGKQVGEKGYFVQPTIFTDVKENMAIAQDEVR